MGFEVLRFTNDQVMSDPPNVLNSIERALDNHLRTPSPYTERGQGEGS
jgi:very-short-patch-repair endonuclease